MARTLYLDCFAGASGDMLLGAMLDCGLDLELLRGELRKLGVEGYELSVSRVDRSGISASKFDVRPTAVPAARNGGDAPAHPHPHPRGDGNRHEHADRHDRSEHAQRAGHDDGHRSLSEIKRIIATSSLGERAKRRAQAIFERIGEAESKLHNVPIESVRFHEVGAIDSIVDIVGACIALDALKIERIMASPLHVGSGTFECAHGTYPVPGPATAELLRGVPIYSKDIEGELTTPTGAAIISTLSDGYGPMPAMKIDRIGYGAGTRDYPGFPNALRILIGEPEEDADRTPATVTVIETNIDDLDAQVFGYLMEQALAAGALDIFYTPVQMKKNRPGVLLTLLCRPEDRERMCDIVFRETTTLGVRYRDERREILRREFVTVETGYGQIRIKVGRTADGRVVNAAPEFEDCRAAAERHRIGLRETQQAAMQAFAASRS